MMLNMNEESQQPGKAFKSLLARMTLAGSPDSPKLLALCKRYHSRQFTRRFFPKRTLRTGRRSRA
jgi:hypothetical protein